MAVWNIYSSAKTNLASAFATITFPYFTEEKDYGRTSIWVDMSTRMFFYRCRHFCGKGRVIGACCQCAGEVTTKLCEVCYGRLPSVES